MFFKLLNAEEIKAAEDKTKAEKKKLKKYKLQVFELSQNSIVTKLREDLELSNKRAQHFEREFFNLQKSHETLTDCYHTITEADQQLKADLYGLTKVIQQKDESISEFTKLVEKQADEIVNQMVKKEPYKCKLTTEEVNDQINELLKLK